MAFTTDVSTDIGKVRLLLTDLDSTQPIFPNDTYIQAFLDLELGDVKCAAALGMETIAGNQALLLKCIQLLDLKTDGKSVADAMLKVATQMRTNANNWSGIDFVQVTDDSVFAWREYLTKQFIAQGA